MMTEQTLGIGDIVVNKKEFHTFKQAIEFNLVDTDKIVVSTKFKDNDNASKYCIRYLDDDDIIRPFALYCLK